MREKGKVLRQEMGGSGGRSWRCETIEWRENHTERKEVGAITVDVEEIIENHVR